MRLKIVFQLLMLLVNEYICIQPSESRLPLIVEGPFPSNNIKNDLVLDTKENGIYDELEEPPAVIKNVDITSNVTKQWDKTTIKCFVKNPSIHKAQEIVFGIELPIPEYKVTNMYLQIHGDNKVYKAIHNEDSTTVYKKLTERKQSVVMIQEVENIDTPLKEAVLLNMSTIIPAGEKLFITLEYEGPIVDYEDHPSAQKITDLSKEPEARSNKSYGHLIHINPHQRVQNFSIKLNIKETLPIMDVYAIEIRDNWAAFGYSKATVKYGNTSESLHVSYYPDEDGKNDEGYDMNGQFLTSYSRDKNFLLRKVGQDITDIATLGENHLMFTSILSALSHSATLIWNMLLMIPFIMITEFINGIYLTLMMLLGADTSWYLNQPMWYERKIEEQFAEFDRVMGFSESIVYNPSIDHLSIKSKSEHLEEKVDVPSPTPKPKKYHNSLFVDFYLLRQEGVSDPSYSKFTIKTATKEPMVRKF